MNKNEYFKHIVSLYESVNDTANTKEIEGHTNTINNIKNEQKQEEEQFDRNEEMRNPEEETSKEDENEALGGESPEMMGFTDQPESIDPNLIKEKEKFKKIFNLFKDLVNYTDMFCDSLEFIDISLLDREKYETMKAYLNEIKELNLKVRNYLINIFNSEKYEKALYTYILFRTELLTAIKSLRNVLDLNSDQNDPKNSEKN